MFIVSCALHTSRVPVTSSRNAVIKRCVRHEAHGQAQSIEVLSTQGKRCGRIVDDRVERMASRRACDERPSSSPARSDCDPNTGCDGHRSRDASVIAALSRDTRDGKPPTIAGQPIGSPVCLCLWANGKGGMTLNSRIPSPYNKYLIVGRTRANRGSERGVVARITVNKAG